MPIPSTWLNAMLYLRYPHMTRVYRQHFNRLPDYVRPTLYNDKIHWRKLFDRNPLFPVFLDKLAVRGYVAAKAPDLRMAELLWTGVDPGAIPFDDLPPRYVIKPNCRSGALHFVLSPEDVRPEQIAAKCRQWLARPYGQLEKQWAYKHVPRRILIEEFLESDAEQDCVRDFRFHVFDGRVYLITVAPCRISDTVRIMLGKTTYYDTDWRQLPYVNTKKQSIVAPVVSRPPQMDAMIAAAETLGKEVDHVRVDLYLVHGQPYFGELTVYPLSGLGQFAVTTDPDHEPVEDYEIRLGRLWRLPEIPALNKMYRALTG